VRPDLRSLWQQFASYGYWKAQMLRRHPRSLRPRQTAAPALLAALALSAGTTLSGWIVPGAPPPMRWAFPATALLYAAAALGVSVAVGSRLGFGVALRLPAVFATMHLAWGGGFWIGLARSLRAGGRGGAR
jgi:hypothetical protein